MAIPLLPKVTDTVRAVYTGDPSVEADGFVGWVAITEATCAGDADVVEFHSLNGEQKMRMVRETDNVTRVYSTTRMGCSGKGTVADAKCENGAELRDYLSRLPSEAIVFAAHYIMALSNGTDPHIRTDEAKAAEPVGEDS